MAVTKRTRFEVLRRDGFKCRYCGLAGPEGSGLTIDHVNPVSLAGSDGPENLVAACKDCNSGKASSSPDASTVAQVSADAVRWAAAMKAAADAELLTLQSRQSYRRAFLAEWKTWDGGLEWLDSQWMSTLHQFQRAGLPIAVLLDDIDLAWGQRKIPERNAFRYMAGIAWNQITAMQVQAAVVVAEPKAAPPTQRRLCGHCHACIKFGVDMDPDDSCYLYRDDRDQDEDLDSPCPHCGSVECLFAAGMAEAQPDAWRDGWDLGEAAGMRKARRVYAPAIEPEQDLIFVVDGDIRRAFPAGPVLLASEADVVRRELDRDLQELGVDGLLARMREADPWFSGNGAVF